MLSVESNQMNQMNKTLQKAYILLVNMSKLDEHVVDEPNAVGLPRIQT